MSFSKNVKHQRLDTTADMSTILHELSESTTPIVTTQTTTTVQSIASGQNGSSDESSQTILIVLGLLLGILVLVCCVLACILARLRRKGFCTVQGRNQETCDEECPGEDMDLGQSTKNSEASVKHMNSRSSDQLLKK
ncbi:uncharacterized protein LOC124301359 [Neodiprion virginianus]|uniref:uncharacterized protein LOC124178915 n=1 Tax=Neodiprion fabricii TaxID=2872261 RepID=UPI001ED94FD0|nr:uncharacterized protein LOC124178915 [Neodiprion fabricii]XP_046612243.1 uncharacterized protein LOC124301359 [Neodiprion virginianus]